MKYLLNRTNELSTWIAVIVVGLLSANIITEGQLLHFFDQIDLVKGKVNEALTAFGLLGVALVPDSKLPEIKNRIANLLSFLVVGVVATGCSMVILPTPAMALEYDDTVIEITHDPVPYSIDRYALYENCSSADSSGKILVNGAVQPNDIVVIDIPPIANLQWCVAVVVKDSNNQDVIGNPFAFHEFPWFDLMDPQNGVFRLRVRCKYPTCVSAEVVTN